jgi:hypothetical protein
VRKSSTEGEEGPPLKQLLLALAQARDMIDVNIAAGLALERLEEAEKAAGPATGHHPTPALKPN